MASNTGFVGFNSGAQNPSGGTNSGFATSQTTGGFGTSAFGAAAAKPAFGAASTTPAFGAAASKPAFGAASTTPAFGAAASTPAFGAAASTPAFGGTAPAFGTASTASALGAKHAFGAASSTPAFGAATSTPAFGATTSTPAFGANAAKPAFGASSTPAFGTASSGPSFGSGFGAASSTPAFGQGFGSNNAVGVGFGQPKVTAAPLGSNFGTGVGQNTSAFGTTTQNNNSVGAAPGSSQSTAFDVLTIQKALEKIGLAKPPDAAPSVLEQCIGIQQSLDSKSQNYLFQSYFYTLIHPSKSNNFAVPNSIPGLQDVQKENPDSRCMVPVLSSGPDGLKERCKAQRAQVALHRAALNKIGTRLEAIAKTQSLDLKSRIDKMQLRHESLRHRIASLNRLALILAQQGAPLCPKEEEMQRQLKEIRSKLMPAEKYEELRNNILTTLNQQKKHFEEITISIKADSNSSKDTRAAINEAIENNNHALDVLKDQLAADIQLTKFLRASTTARST
ncbi:hypothetical protein DSO57_1019929 [Entomophthora muscae]|uniref:Uncharacterized protein n=1 Tax=Entomophthora muscae TaxID=34485 RepID=A0ACC2RIG3_9FUNG|nr:hypothetical protein DSO57_1019929 [Entomophthora muscae]